jgi:hypothetical protein
MGENMELKIQDGKFWILENRSEEKNIERYCYDNEKSAMSRVKQMLKSVDAQKLFLSTVDMTGKDWQIIGVQWSVIAMGIVRDEMSEKEEKNEINI